MNERIKKIIIGILIIISAIVVYKIPRLLINKNKKPLPEVKLKETNDKKSFAIMIQNENGYEEYNKDTWPTEDYKFKEAKCIDNNGSKVDNAITYNNGKVSLITNQTIYCTLYFDMNKGKTALELLQSKPKDLSTTIQGDMYRYQGIGEVSNWICFGTTENCGANDDLIDTYMYRIIGITPEGEMKLIKETFLKENNITEFGWYHLSGVIPDTSVSCPNGKCPEWKDSTLLKRINGLSNGNTFGAGTYSKEASTDIFVDSKEYNYLKSGDNINGGSDASNWYKIISNHEWMFGDTNEKSKLYNGDAIFKIESGKINTNHYVCTFYNSYSDNDVHEESYTWNEKVKAKISLLQIHDIAYSFYDGVSEDTRGNPNNSSNLKNSWIFFQKDGYNNQHSEGLSTQYGLLNYSNDSFSHYRITMNGVIDSYPLSTGFGVRPVFYLSSEAKIKDGGDGTKTNPFILNVS